MLALALDRTDEGLERDVRVARLLGQDTGAATPGPHDQRECRGDQDRDVATVVDFHEVGAQEDRARAPPAGEHGDCGRQRPVPAGADELEGHDGGDDHGAGHRDAVGDRQRIRRLEAYDEEDDAEEQHRVDATAGRSGRYWSPR